MKLLKKCKSLLLSRTTVLVLLLLLALCFTSAVIFTQVDAETVGTGAPKKASAIVEFLGLNRVFTTWWFVTVAGIFVLSLLFSTLEQWKVAWARTFQAPRAAGDTALLSSLPRESIEKVLGAAGYRRLSATPGRSRHAKFWLGYWGSFLLHAGITVSCLFSFVYVLTENRVSAHIVSDQVNPSAPILSARKLGVLASGASLPARVVLTKVAPEFGDDNHLEELTSELVFLDAAGASQRIRLKVNEQQKYRGLRVYELAQFGTAFFLEFEDGKGGNSRKILSLPMPPERKKAGYGEMKLEDGRVIKAKYYANADMSSMVPNNPLWC